MRQIKILMFLIIMIFVYSEVFAFGEVGLIKNSTFPNHPNPSKRKKVKEEMPYKQVFSFYPVKALSNYIMMGYERQIGAKNALKVTAGYVKFEEQTTSTNFDFDVRDYSGLRFDIAVKYFIGENNPVYNGIYFSPFISFKNAKFKYNTNGFSFPNPTPDEFEEGSATSLNAGFIFGYQLPVGESFSIDAYVGNALKKSSGDYPQATRLFDPFKNSIGLIAGLSVGFGF